MFRSFIDPAIRIQPAGAEWLNKVGLRLKAVPPDAAVVVAE
jgi:hypothetical protein